MGSERARGRRRREGRRVEVKAPWARDELSPGAGPRPTGAFRRGTRVSGGVQARGEATGGQIGRVIPCGQRDREGGSRWQGWQWTVAALGLAVRVPCGRGSGAWLTRWALLCSRGRC